MIEVGFGSPSEEPPGGSDMQDNVSDEMPGGSEEAMEDVTAAAVGAAAAACAPVAAAGPCGLPGAMWFAEVARAPPAAGEALFGMNEVQSLGSSGAVPPSEEGFDNEAAPRGALSSGAPSGALSDM